MAVRNKQTKKKYLQSGCKKCRFVYHGEKLGHRPSVPSRCSFPRGLALPACSGEATGQSSLLPTCRPFLPKSGARHLPRGCRGAVPGAGCRAPLAHPDLPAGAAHVLPRSCPGHCSLYRLRVLVLGATSVLNNAQHTQTELGWFPLEGPRVGERTGCWQTGPGG